MTDVIVAPEIFKSGVKSSQLAAKEVGDAASSQIRPSKTNLIIQNGAMWAFEMQELFVRGFVSSSVVACYLEGQRMQRDRGRSDEDLYPR